MLTPVRRSTRKTPSKYRHGTSEQDKAALLEQCNYAFKPNEHLASTSGAQASGTASRHSEEAAAAVRLPALGQLQEETSHCP